MTILSTLSSALFIILNPSDRMTSEHLCSVLDAHHVEYTIIGTNNFKFVVDPVPANLIATLNHDAPPALFSFRIEGLRSISKAKPRWVWIKVQPSQFRYEKRLDLYQFFRDERLRPEEVTSVWFFKREYRSSPNKYETGFEVHVSTNTVDSDYQVLNFKGKRLVVKWFSIDNDAPYSRSKSADGG